MSIASKASSGGVKCHMICSGERVEIPPGRLPVYGVLLMNSVYILDGIEDIGGIEQKRIISAVGVG